MVLGSNGRKIRERRGMCLLEGDELFLSRANPVELRLATERVGASRTFQRGSD